ncbi:MAG: hypothetical protein WC758_08155 [Candidatus Woesearchaeota archaeon]|jgi:hypothetical protein
MKKKEILQAEKEYQKIIREYGYEAWADSNMHNDPESIIIMVILKKVLDIEKILKQKVN